MRIQNINMAVPVGGDGGDEDETLRDEIAVEEAELNHLTLACVDAVRKRDKFVWSSKARAAREEQFKREVKGIVKRWVSASTEMVADRDTRSRLRVRQYSELVGLALNLCTDTDTRWARRRWWVSSAFTCLAVFTLALGLVLALVWPG